MAQPVKIWTSPGMGRSLIDHDPRNRNYPVRGAVFDPAAPLRPRMWRRGNPYDQGMTPHCVAFTGKGMFNTKPFSSAYSYWKRSRFSTQTFYDGAQANDEWPGIDYDGTSARGLLIFLRSIGLIKEYRWCFGTDDILRTLSNWGPVSMGTWWKSDMFNPDPKTGLISYSGSNNGGHQWQLIGIDPKKEEVTAMNSWGKGWGLKGKFKIKFDVLDKIVEDDADAHTLVTI
jgi:hypothetical protein